MKRMTVSCEAGYWYASLTIETPEENKPLKTSGQILGIDLGLKTFATLSTGEQVANLKPLAHAQKKLSHAQRSLSRKVKGSHRREKVRLRVARLYSRVANVRVDMAHKLTTRLVKEYAVIGIEDLSVQNMMKNHRLAKAISDAGFYQFRHILEYKCVKEGTQLVVADRFYPSSKTCSQCGEVKTKLSLKERVFECEQCGLILDRDLNAAINLCRVAESASETLNAHGEPRSLVLA